MKPKQNKNTKKKMGRPRNKDGTSARLRVTQRVADLAGIDYKSHLYPYGGFFDTYQLEQIEEKLKELERNNSEHTHPSDR